MRIQMVLTVAESKKLISKALLQMDVIRRRLEKGIVVFHPSSTTCFILEELKLPIPEHDLWVCGHIQPAGLCLSQPIVDRLTNPAYAKSAQTGEGYPFEYVFVDGQFQAVKDSVLGEVVDRMTEEDVYVKTVNAIDPEGNCGVLLAVPGGGSVGHIIRSYSKKRFQLVVASGLEKAIFTPIKEAARLCRQMQKATGMRCTLIPIKYDHFVSEVEAFGILTGATATPISAGGIEGMEGGITFIVEGESENIDRAWKMWESLRGAKLPPVNRYDCASCPMVFCSRSGSYDPEATSSSYLKDLMKQA